MSAFTSDLKRYNVTPDGYRAIRDGWKRHGRDLGHVPRGGWRLFRVLAPNEPGSCTPRTLRLGDGRGERCFDEPYSFRKEPGASNHDYGIRRRTGRDGDAHRA